MPKVPNILRKLNLLIDYTRFRDIDELAAAFGKERKTLYSWGKGGGEHVPSDSYKVLVGLVSKALNHGLSETEIVELLAAPSAFPLEEELVAAPARPLGDIVAAEADRTAGTLFVKPRPSLGLVEAEDEEELKQGDVVELQQWFRIEFRTPLGGGQILAMQHVGQTWSVLRYHFDAEVQIIHLPGLKASGGIAHMREKSEYGLHSFIVMQTQAPFPPSVRNLLANRTVFDSRLLNRLSIHYESHATTARRLFALDLLVERPDRVSREAR